MFKSLHWLVLKSYIGPLIATFFVSEFILIMQFLWLYIDDLVGKGLEFALIAELLLYSAAGLVQMALPLAILLASIMTFGDLGENYELTAMKSAGISLQRIMLPLIIFSIIISIAAFFFSNNVVPYTNLKAGSILYDIGTQRPELNIKEGIFNRDIDNYSIKIKSKSPNSQMMYDFMIYDHHEKRGNPKVTLADSGIMNVTDDQRYMIITLHSGISFEEMREKNNAKKNYPDRKDVFSKETIILELKGFDLERTDEKLFKHNYQMKNLNNLALSEDSLKILLNEKRNDFVTDFRSNKYFKYQKKINLNKRKTVKNSKDSVKEIKRYNAEIKQDSIFKQISPEDLKIVENIDSIYNSLIDNKKRNIINSAKETAESYRKTISQKKSSLYEREKNIYKHQVAWHEKFTLSFACFIFFFIGAPLGAIIRKGGFGLPFIVAIIFFIIYYVISLTGRKFATEGVVLSWQGMWMSSFFTLPMGVFLTYKATTDSVLFDFDTYLTIIKRPFKVLEIKTKDPSIIFYKDVEKIETSEIIDKLKILINESKEMENTLNFEIQEFKSFLKFLFIKDKINLNKFVANYDEIFKSLSVEYKKNLYVIHRLEKLPIIEEEKYIVTDKKIFANYLLISFLIFPFGVVVFFRSYLKIRTLIQKFKLIKELSKDILKQLD